MKFIEINNSVCVNSEQISWVASADEGLSSIIYIGNKEYPSDIPYKSLISLLQFSDNSRTMEKLDKYLSVATVQSV